jgi:hypothetical protein
MGLSKIKGPNKSTGFYILPRAENKTATAYQGQGKDTCIDIRRKSAMWTNSVEVCQRAQRTSSWTRGLLSLEEREEYLKHNHAKIIAGENLLATVCIF